MGGLLEPAMCTVPTRAHHNPPLHLFMRLMLSQPPSWGALSTSQGLPLCESQGAISHTGL